MNVQGAKPLLASQAVDGMLSWDGAVLSSGEFGNVLLVKGVLGDIAHYISGFKRDGGQLPPFVVPMMIDWRLFHGPGDCVFDQHPVEGTTVVHSEAGLAREGMLWTVGGIMAGQFLLQGRIRGGGDLRLNVTLRTRVSPPAAVGELRVTAGSGIG